MALRYGFFKDHPRLCGEKFFRRIRTAQLPGSPPPMRGKVRHEWGVYRANRITPAYAGKRFPCCTKSAAYWDHPRLCGEKTEDALKFWWD